jgi:hypothetical protein
VAERKHSAQARPVPELAQGHRPELRAAMKTQMSIWRGFSCETEVAVTWAATPASSGIGALATMGCGQTRTVQARLDFKCALLPAAASSVIYASEDFP